MMFATKSGVRVDVVVGSDQLTAVVQARGVTRVETVPLLLPGNGEDAAAVGSAFEALAARVRAALGRDPAGLTITIALLPPLTDARLLALPPLRHAEAEAVVRRDAARHFVGGAAARVVAVRTPPVLARRRGDHAPLLAAAAPAQLAEALRAAARRVQWQVGRIVPAHGAWIAAAERAAQRSSAGSAIAAVALLGDTLHVIRLERGAVTRLRRVQLADVPELGAALGSGPGAAAIFAAEREPADAIARTLTDAGWTAIRGPDATQVAAAHAHTSALELVPVSLLAEQDQQQRTRAARLLTAALVLVVGAAALQLWGAQRELTAVRAQRAALRPQVAPLLETRDSLDRLEQRAAALRSLDDAPRWTRALFDIALLLPPDAYITSFRGAGDTLEIAAQGARAGAALQALRGATSLSNVKLDGPVERDLEAGTTTLERFTLSARVVADTARRTP